MTETSLERARRWAEALDRDAFEELPALLHPECCYRGPKGETRGPTEIVASYQKNAEWAHATFDRITWDSELTLDADGRVRITFIDRTEHRGVRHEYRCQQLVRFDGAGLIDEIEHVPIPEEERRLAAFFERVGVERA